VSVCLFSWTFTKRKMENMTNILLIALKEKCPFCGHGDIFKKRAGLHLPEMRTQCPECRRNLVGEPGYFFGAMYVSYGISVALGLAEFILLRVIAGVQAPAAILIPIVTSMVLISFKNFKWSRIIWLKLFPPGENTYFEEKAGRKTS
jgi:hypothetical protein